MKKHTPRVAKSPGSVDALQSTCPDKTILIVDDDMGTRQLLARHLRDQQLEVFEADTGDAAIIVMETGLQPDLLLTDIVMPGAIQGPELAQKARALMPGLPVLFMSGYPVVMSHHSGGIAPTDQQLMKPVSQDRLVTTVRDMLMAACTD
ncbi:MAG: response regulator [Pseudomonadota bacterium]